MSSFKVDRAPSGARPQLSYKLRAMQSEYNGLVKKVEQAKRPQFGMRDNWDQPDKTRLVYIYTLFELSCANQIDIFICSIVE